MYFCRSFFRGINSQIYGPTGFRRKNWFLICGGCCDYGGSAACLAGWPSRGSCPPSRHSTGNTWCFTWPQSEQIIIFSKCLWLNWIRSAKCNISPHRDTLWRHNLFITKYSICPSKFFQSKFSFFVAFSETSALWRYMCEGGRSYWQRVACQILKNCFCCQQWGTYSP